MDSNLVTKIVRNVNEFKRPSAYARSLDPLELSTLNKIGLIFLRPEAFYAGQVENALGHIEKKGFRFLAFKIADRLHEEDIRRLLPKVTPEDFRTWMVQKRFMMGPTAALLVYSVDSPPDIHPYIYKLKGHFNPFRAKEGTLRHLLPAINGLLNFVHSPESEEFFVSDLSVFFSLRELKSAIASYFACKETLAHNIAKEDILDLYCSGYTGVSAGISFFTVFGKLMHRLIVKLLSLPCDHSSMSEYRSLQRETAKFIKACEKTGDRFDQLAAMRDFALQSYGRVRNLEADSGDESDETRLIIQSLLTLLDLPSAEKVDWVLFYRRLSTIGIVVDGWEELILLSTQYYMDKYLELVPPRIPRDLSLQPAAQNS